ncbi:MAG TPA: FcoT family thioesterase [Terriglobia bacterium]|nr:FcoT family thioesterase [Terriglobia bacterium]
MSQAAVNLMPESRIEMAVNPSLIERVLAPYKLHCRYLVGATGEYSPGGYPAPSGRGEFSIPESCYIADTGHFNAVEFNICYNQLAYCLLANAIQNQWLEAFAGWNVDQFLHRQLTDCLIVNFSSSFRKPLNARQFTGELALDKVSLKRGTIFLKTSCSFRDSHGATSEGDAMIAVIANGTRVNV